MTWCQNSKKRNVIVREIDGFQLIFLNVFQKKTFSRQYMYTLRTRICSHTCTVLLRSFRTDGYESFAIAGHVLTDYVIFVTFFAVGYTMRDIRYQWNSGIKSVGISNEVQLPQFRVLGHRQRATEINLSTGTRTRPNHPHVRHHIYVHIYVVYV